MAYFKLTKEERLARAREARRGWGSTAKMTALEKVAWRRRERAKARKAKKEEDKKREIDAKKSAAEGRKSEAKKEAPAGAERSSIRRGSRIKYLLVILIALLIIYLILRFTGNL